MADNINITPGAGATVATDDVGSLHYQRVKLDVGGDGLTIPVVGALPVTGIVTANAGTGTFAVSAASLPLPSGAATSAKQPALGTAGTASTDVITVQGIASGTALPVSLASTTITGSVAVTGPLTDAQLRASVVPVSLTSTTVTGTVAVTDNSGSLTVDAPVGTPAFVRLSDGAAAISTLPVSLATLPALTAGAAVIGALTANQSVNVAQINGITPLMGNGVTGTGSQRVTIASDQTAFSVNSTLSAETTKVIGTVNIAAAQTVGLAAGAAAIGTVGVTSLPALVAGAAIVGKVGIDQTTPGTTNLVSIGTNGTVALNAAIPTGANVIGALTANQSVNLAQVAGTATATGSGVVGAGVQRVVLATDVALPTGANVVGAVTQSGTWNIGSITTVPGVADVTGSGSLAALNATVALTITSGYSAAVLQISGTWVGTITFEGTADGTNWVSINGVVAGTSTPGTTTTANGIVRLTPAGLTQFRVNMTAYTSGSAVVTLRAGQGTGGTFLNQSLTAGSNIIGKVGIDQTTPGTTNLVALTAETTKVIGTVNPPALTKGTQGANGFTTQDLKDAGRTLFSAATVIAGVTAVTVEALVTMVPTRAGVASGTVTSQSVTSGKTLRLTGINVGFISTAAAVLSMRFALRMNPAGAAVATSPILRIFAVPSGAALAQAGGSMDIEMPDGFEFSGTQQFGITQIGSVATGTIWISMTGFEY